MGTTGAPPPPAGRSARGPSSPAGWIVAVVLAVALAALVAFEFGKRSHVDQGPPAATGPLVAAAQAPIPSPAPAATPESQPPAPAPPQEGRVERAVMEVTIAPPPPVREIAPEPREPPAPAPTRAETLHDKMLRCLSFSAEDDEDDAVSVLQIRRVRVTVRNRCDLTFDGSEVWFEARAIPVSGGGTAARETGRFQEPIRGWGRSETLLGLACLCSPATHRLEARLWWASGGGRTE